MSTQGNPESPSADLHRALAIINELALKAAGGNYIFRGESECNDKVSSSLYREYEWGSSSVDQGLDMEDIQQFRLDAAKSFAFEADEWELLTQIQHYGGNTNLIDFTFDYLIALFFACDGKHSASGRVILLDMEGDMSEHIVKPSQPANRVIAQKSVFVRPPTGIIIPDCVVEIPAGIKLQLLGYLDKAHGISAETMYNDLHGYIRYRAMHSEAFAMLNEGFILHGKGDYKSAIDRYTVAIDYHPRLVIAYLQRGLAYSKDGNYDDAITDCNIALQLHPGLSLAYSSRGLVQAREGDYEDSILDFTEAVDIDPNFGSAYCNRGEAWLCLSELDKAKADLVVAKDLGVDIVASFHNDYESVADFEQRTGITVPPDIAEMLGG